MKSNCMKGLWPFFFYCHNLPNIYAFLNILSHCLNCQYLHSQNFFASFVLFAKMTKSDTIKLKNCFKCNILFFCFCFQNFYWISCQNLPIHYLPSPPVPLTFPVPSPPPPAHTILPHPPSLSSPSPKIPYNLTTIANSLANI